MTNKEVQLGNLTIKFQLILVIFEIEYRKKREHRLYFLVISVDQPFDAVKET